MATGIERSRIARHESGTGGTPQGKTLLRYERAYGLPLGSLAQLLADEGPLPATVRETAAPYGALRHPGATRGIARELKQMIHDFTRDVRSQATLDDMDYISASLSDENILRLLGDASPDRPLSTEEQVAEIEIRLDELRAWLKRRIAIRKRSRRH